MMLTSKVPRFAEGWSEEDWALADRVVRMLSCYKREVTFELKRLKGGEVALYRVIREEARPPQYPGK